MFHKSQAKLKSRHTLGDWKVHTSRALTWKTRKTKQNETKMGAGGKGGIERQDIHASTQSPKWYCGKTRGPLSPWDLVSNLCSTPLLFCHLGLPIYLLFAYLCLSNLEIPTPGIWIKSNDAYFLLFNTMTIRESRTSVAIPVPDI